MKLRKVQAQRKFAQGAIILAQVASTHLERRAHEKTAPAPTVLHNMSARALLDQISFNGLHNHHHALQPIVRLERLQPERQRARKLHTPDLPRRKSLLLGKIKKRAILKKKRLMTLLRPTRFATKRKLGRSDDTDTEDETPLKYLAKSNEHKTGSTLAVASTSGVVPVPRRKTRNPLTAASTSGFVSGPPRPKRNPILPKRVQTKKAASQVKPAATPSTSKLPPDTMVFYNQDKIEHWIETSANATAKITNQFKMPLPPKTRSRSTATTVKLYEDKEQPTTSNNRPEPTPESVVREECAVTEDIKDAVSSCSIPSTVIVVVTEHSDANDNSERDAASTIAAPSERPSSPALSSRAPSVCPSERYVTVQDVVRAPVEDRQSRCRTCPNCSRVDKVEMLSRVVQATTDGRDVYEFDAEREGNESVKGFRSRRRSGNGAANAKDSDYVYLDILPAPSDHVIQIKLTPVMNQKKPMMQARLMPKTSAASLNEYNLVEHEGLFEQLIETLDPNSLKKLTVVKPPDKSEPVAGPSKSTKAGPEPSKTAKTPQDVSTSFKTTKTSPNVSSKTAQDGSPKTNKTPQEVTSKTTQDVSTKSTKTSKTAQDVSKSSQVIAKKKDQSAEVRNVPRPPAESQVTQPAGTSTDTNQRERASSPEDTFSSDMPLINRVVADKNKKIAREKAALVQKPRTTKLVKKNGFPKKQTRPVPHVKKAKAGNKSGASPAKASLTKPLASSTPLAGSLPKAGPSTGGGQFTPGKTGATVREAPVYYPTEEEFNDPVAYFEKIRPTASKFGICKVVAPKSFKPRCNIHEKISFTVANQYIARLYTRWGPACKEMCAIKAHLATQRVLFTRPPILDSIEVDLPKLYRTVQCLGGLRTVIEKKLWGRVAEHMRFAKKPKVVKKLDDIYVTHLLPYDTLSSEEREDIRSQVYRSWHRKNEKIMQRMANPLHRQKQLLGESGSSTSDTEDDSNIANALLEAEDCIVAGRRMMLNNFTKIAKTIKSQYFPDNPEPSPREVEDEYWRIVLLAAEHICVNTASIDTGEEGYGFPKNHSEPYGTHPWNLKMISQNPGNVLAMLGPVLGVTVPTLHLGMMFSTSCWHRDPHGLPWLEYMHSGPAKIWYGIPDDQSTAFRTAVERLCPTSCQNKSIWLPSDITMIPPNFLLSNNVSLTRVEQKPGEYIIVCPKAYSSSISTGYTQSESVYFATNSWLKSVDHVFQELRESCEPTMFSLEQLLISVAGDPRAPPSLLQLVHTTLATVVEDELQHRRELTRLGLATTRTARPHRNRLGAWSDECEVCRATLYLSKVTGLIERKSSVCLKHALRLLSSSKTKRDVSTLSLIVYFTKDQLRQVMLKLQNGICPQSG